LGNKSTKNVQNESAVFLFDVLINKLNRFVMQASPKLQYRHIHGSVSIIFASHPGSKSTRFLAGTREMVVASVILPEEFLSSRHRFTCPRPPLLMFKARE